MGILRARNILLDTSILANIARDMFGSVPADRERARRCWALLQEQGWVPILVVEHIVELLGHQNDEVIGSRVRLLTELPMFTSPCGGADRGPVAIAANVLSLEVEAIITKGLSDALSVREEVRQRLFSYFDGLTLQNWIAPDLPQFRERAREHSIRVRETASLGRAQYTDGNTKIRSITGQGDSTLAEQQAWLAEHTATELREYGDPRLKGHDRIASEWAEGIRDRLEGVVAQEDPHEALTRSFGIPPECVPPNATVDDVGELAVYARNLRIVSDSLALPQPLTIKDVPPELCPSWMIRSKVAFVSRRARRVAGSDIIDSFLVALLPYADVVVADKRTAAYCRQLLAKLPELSKLANPILNVGDYADVPRAVADLIQ